MATTFGPATANENERRRQTAIFGHFLDVRIDGYGAAGPTATEIGPIDVPGLLDTGASDVCIDYRIAIALGLTLINQTNVGVVGGSTLASIYLGRLIVPSVGFDRVMPLYALKVRQPTHQVLLGRSFLQNYIVTFDGPAGMLHFDTRRNEDLLGAIEDDYAT